MTLFKYTVCLTLNAYCSRAEADCFPKSIWAVKNGPDDQLNE